MKNTVKKVLCTFIAVVAAVTSTLVFTACIGKNSQDGTCLSAAA